jgi:hypothetical protein
MGSARSLLPPWRRVNRDAEIGWLSLTPEPERELPPIVAALRSGDSRGLGGALEQERSAVEEIVVRGEERDWLNYLGEAVRLLLDSPAVGLSADQRQAALEVLANHHRLLLGLPGDAAERTEAERIALERAIDASHADAQANHRNGGP